jgi:hypothetical protein
MLLESINKRLAALKDRMDTHTETPKKIARKAARSVVTGAKTIGIKVEPKLYGRIQRFKEQRGITSMKLAVIALCTEALDHLKIS